MKKEVVIEAKPIDIGIIKNFVNPLTKPDLQSYLQFVFAARGPLPFLEPIKKDNLREYDSFITKELNPVAMFRENNSNQKYDIFKSTDQVRREKYKEFLKNKIDEFKKWRKNINEINEYREEDFSRVVNDLGENIKFSSNPYKTLIAFNLSYDLKEEELKEFFESYGEVDMVRIIQNNGKSRGYGFVEFKNEKDFLYALNKANNKLLKDRKIKVDAERARICDEFRPMRLGGGKNKSRKIKKKIKKKKTEEEEKPKKVFKPKRYNQYNKYPNKNNYNKNNYNKNNYNNNNKNSYRRKNDNYSRGYSKRRYSPSYEKWNRR